MITSGKYVIATDPRQENFLLLMENKRGNVLWRNRRYLVVVNEDFPLPKKKDVNPTNKDNVTSNVKSTIILPRIYLISSRASVPIS